MKQPIVFTILMLLLLPACGGASPEPEYTLTIFNESDFVIEVYLNDDRKGTVNSLAILRASGQPTEIAGNKLNVLDVKGLTEGTYILRVVYKNRIDPSSEEETEMVEELDIDSDLEIMIGN